MTVFSVYYWGRAQQPGIVPEREISAGRHINWLLTDSQNSGQTRCAAKVKFFRFGPRAPENQ